MYTCGLGYHFGGQHGERSVSSISLSTNLSRSNTRHVRNNRTLLDELIAAGEDPDPLVPGGFISFSEQIPSTGTSELSNLSE